MRKIALLTLLLTACGGSSPDGQAASTEGNAASSGDTSMASSGSSGSGGSGAGSGSSSSQASSGSGSGGGSSVMIPANPFGSHTFTYAAGSILPDSASQADLDKATSSYYDTWKGKYLKAGCGAGRYYIETKTEAGNLTVSEGHGYGMLLSAIMAGHDPDARKYFDGMYLYFRDHPSATSPDLMAWYQDASCANAQGQDSASDGDIDIAFALLLADKQWGSCDDINYKAEALKVIEAIKTKTLDATHSYVLLGDWADPGDAKFYKSTRSSDFVIDHFKSFGAASGDPTWTGLVDSTYKLIATMRTKYSPATGLLPDFIKDPLGAPAPAAANFLEGANDGAYDYNACRDPWRLATDFLVSGDDRAKTAALTLTTWIKGATGGDPASIRAGYQLNGTPSAGSDYLTMAFAAPFGPAAMVNGSNKAWLNAVWQEADSAAPEGYYEDTIKLLTMVVMSGNWWAPEARPEVCSPAP